MRKVELRIEAQRIKKLARKVLYFLKITKEG
jgi:hypothetical protein